MRDKRWGDGKPAGSRRFTNDTTSHEYDDNGRRG
jgi:hypothetical protein